MNSIFKIFALSVASATLFSCNKIKDDDNNNGGGNTPAVTPNVLNTINLSDADGVFVGIKTHSTQSTPMGEVDMVIGTAVAAVGNMNTSTFNDVGKVVCRVGTNSQVYELTKQSNNSYVYTPGLSNATGIPFTTGSAGIPFWEVTSLNLSTGSYYHFPSKGNLTSAKKVTKSQDYELTYSGADGGSEVMVVIASQDKYVYKVLKSNSPEYANKKVTFTASELSVLPNSNMALIQVVPYTLYDKTISGKKYYFINETVTSVNAEVN